MIKGFDCIDVYILAGLCFFASGHWICGLVCASVAVLGIYVNVKERLSA